MYNVQRNYLEVAATLMKAPLACCLEKVLPEATAAAFLAALSAFFFSLSTFNLASLSCFLISGFKDLFF